jgi:pimeloyl-ACP methyl ester carboxylesterase
MKAMRKLAHGRLHLAVHDLANEPGPGLLAVHALRGSSVDWGDSLSAWQGRVHAVDLSGHGSSDALRGGGASPELLAADVDVALAETGARFLVGRGLGAYLVLLVAGCRPAEVDAALLLPGAGLDGGGVEPCFEQLAERFAAARRAEGDAGPTAWDHHALECDVRPPDYARSFADRARRLLLLEDGAPRPPWWIALRGGATVRGLRSPTFRDALAELRGR